MSITPTYPGVYVSEVPSGNRTIVGVATSITAFLGKASRGPSEKPMLVNSFPEFQRLFGDLSRDSALGYAVSDFYLNGGGTALIVRVVHHAPQAPAPPPGGPPAVPGAPGAAPAGKDAATTTWELDVGAPTKLKVTASGPGSWANNLKPKVEYVKGDDAKDVAAGQGVGEDDLFNLIVVGGPFGEEIYRNITLVDGPRRMDRVLMSSQTLSVAGKFPDLTAANAKHRPTEGDFPAATITGDDGSAPDANDYKRALVALRQADLVNLVCIPPITPEGELPTSVWAEAATFCRDRRAFLLIDPRPSDITPDAVKTWATGKDGPGISGPVASYAALFFPRILRTDPLHPGTRSTLAPSGAIAGVFARTDASRGVWKAPAGIDAGLADAFPAVPLTDDDNGQLNPSGINCLRNFPDTGTVVWGSRTRRGADTLADDYKYIPVRRMALFLEESLYRGTQWVVFEPNDEPLWSQIRNSIGAFMQDLFRRGAFQGATPRDAYFVQCGKDTTTQYDIDRGIVNIWVGFAPLKPAEFVMITIRQKAAQPA